MSGGFAEVPGTGQGSYFGIDPSGFTKQAGQNIFGDPAQNMMNKGQGAMNSWVTSANDPNSFMGQFMNDFSRLQSGITDATSPLNKQLESQQAQNIQQGLQAAGSQLSGLGGLRSSGMGAAAGDVVGRAANDMTTQLRNAQLGMLGQYGGQAMGQRGAANQQMMGMPGQMMGIQSGFGDPTYGQAQMYQKPGAMDWINTGANLISSIGSVIPF